MIRKKKKTKYFTDILPKIKDEDIIKQKKKLKKITYNLYQKTKR